MKRIIPLFLFAALPATAQDWATRSDDRLFTPDTLFAAVDGQQLTFFDDGQARFMPDGAYSYTLSEINGGATQFGRYEITEDSQVCVLFENGLGRCDLYVFASGRIVVLTEDGGRFPVRDVARLQDAI